MLDEKNNNINDKFSTEEFVFLQNFITDAFKYREEKDQAKLSEINMQREAEQLKYVSEVQAQKAKVLQLENETNKKLIEEQEMFKTVVKQMLHDIQSPISGLDMIINETSCILPEQIRVTLRNATDHIGDITKNLLNRYGNEPLIEKDSTLLVSLALLQIISEKRYEYKNSTVKFEHRFTNNADFAFIKINSASFKRMISNLINNAVQAILISKNKLSGIVEIELAVTPEKVIVHIKDNGYSMPQHIQDKFYNEIPITEGKEDGHGIGLTQVNKTIKMYGGKCDIYANTDMGTEMVIKFPLILTPRWIATEIKITKDDTIVILDDDDSIHGAWDSKFKNILEQFQSINIQHFSQGLDVISFINALTNEQKQNTLLLADYELLNQNLNGLDVIAQTKMNRAILVTSHASKIKIQDLVISAGIKTLPKELTPVVPIVVDKKIQKWSKKVDMVWVEDQKYFVDTAVRNFYKHLTVDIYYDPDKFMEDVEQYPLDTRIILDTYYFTQDKNQAPYTLDGFIIAKQLHKMGYTKLILCSGETVEKKYIPEYLTVVLKNNSQGTQNLDKI